MRHPHRNRRAATLRSLFAIVVAAIGLSVLAPALPAFAGDPVDLNGAYIVDESGVLGSDQVALQNALDTLSTEHGVNLFVVYTDSFTNPADRQQWANAVAEKNQFGTNDVLLAVATEDRVYQLSVDNSFPLSDEQLAAIETDDIVPALRDNDWAGAGIGAAKGIGEALGGGGGSSGGGGAVIAWVIAIVIILVAAALLIVFLVRRRKKIDAGVNADAAAAGPTQKELDRQVGAVLVDLDDAVTSSEEELGFAVAQFGTDATKTFSDVLAEVKGKLSEAFALKQKLDDAEPDTDEERRAWSQQIIAICDEAADKLDAQADAFAALRDVERDPATALETAKGELAALTGSGTDARERLARLTQQYDPPALTTAGGSIEQADQLRTFADAQLTSAASAIAAGDSAAAALSISAARQAVAQAGTLVTSITTLESDLQKAGAGLAAAIADAQQDITEAARIQASGTSPDPNLPGLATALGVEVHRAQTTGARDPLNARIALEAANTPLDQALATARTEQERVSRLIAQRDRAIATAQSEVAAAASYLQTRRGAVGPDARTRLSEAQRHLDQSLALATTDPESSLREASTAANLASRATAAAQQDVNWAQSSGNQGMPTGGGGGGDFSGALLGGILGGLLSGGGGGRSSGGFGGWGGGSRSGGWGGGSRGGGGGFSGGRSSGGSSGGRRGGGGRF
ncbi:TPM domain-containing protein [Herbiconiux sp. UC225_62]|uniref:TPM domain-containing protein n=1 Tax=Herbiconiux sp. UC225_62 TaxID=3350168 RepID=UPI0036D26A57